MLALSRRVRFSPVLLARLLVENMLHLPKKAVGDFIRCLLSTPQLALRGLCAAGTPKS